MSRKLPISENKDTVFFLIQLGGIFCVFCFFIPLLNIALRLVDYSLLLKVSLGGVVAMNPVTSACLMLLSAALWIIRDESHSALNKMVSNVMCVIVTLIGLAKFMTLILNIPFGLDEHFFREQLILPESYLWESRVNEISPNSALSLFLLALSIILIDRRAARLYRSPELIIYFLIFISLLAIYGHVYQVRTLYVVLGIIPMSFHSALCFFLLSTAVLFLRPYKGSMVVIIDQSPSEVFMMRFLALVIPLFLGWLKIQGQKADFFSEEYGTALFATCTFVISMLLMGWKSSIQYKLGTENKKKLFAIRSERKRFRNILNQSPIIINIVNVESDRILFTNDAGRGVFKGRKPDFDNIRFSDFLNKYVYEEDKGVIEKSYKKLSRLSKHEFLDAEFRVKDDRGHIYWLLSRAIVFRYRADKPVEFVFNALERTEEKLKERELKKKNEQMEEKHKELQAAREKLEELNKKLESKVKERHKELVWREERYQHFFELGFKGITQFEVGGIEGIDIDLPVDEQVELIVKHTRIAQVNKRIVEMYEVEDKEEMIGKPLGFLLKTSKEQKYEYVKAFVESGYKTHNVVTEIETAKGRLIKVRENHIGIIEDKKLIRGWSIQVRVK